MPPEAYTALIDEAHKRKLRVAAHLVNLADAKGLVNAGLDVIAHSIRDQDVDAAFIAELKRRNVGYIPTLTRDLSVFQYESTPDYINDPFFLRGDAALRAADRARERSRAAREDEGESRHRSVRSGSSIRRCAISSCCQTAA